MAALTGSITLSPLGVSRNPYQERTFDARVFPFSPDWSDPYVTIDQFKTEAVTSRSGKEQRRALRHKPRFASEFSVFLANGDLAVYDTVMAGWQNKLFVMPDFVSYVSLESAANPLDTTLDLPASDWINVGASIILDDGTRKALHFVDSVTGGITVSPIIDQNWPVGTRVYQGYAGYLNDSLSSTQMTNMTARAKIRFDAIPDNRPVVETAAGTVIDGRELFLKKPNWSSSPQITYNAPVESIDFDRGAVAFFRVIEFCNRVTKSTYLCKSKAEVKELKDFFARMYGARSEFLAPTWNVDMVMAAAVSSGALQMTVQGDDLATYHVGDTVFDRFVIVNNDGTMIHNKIDALALSSGNTVITCATALPAIDPADVLMICWVPAWTFASDVLTINWLTDEVATVDLSIRTVEDLTV